MKYKRRFLEDKLAQAAKHLKVIMILGARQVGKSTLLKNYLPNAECFVLDSILDPLDIRTDPDLFLSLHQSPIIFDEVQFAPTLLSAIKRKVDSSDQPGLYFLTGSQNFTLLKNISEALTGRVLLLQLEGMSLQERQEVTQHQKPWLSAYLDDPYAFIQSKRTNIPGLPLLHEVIWRGSLPAAFSLPQELIAPFFTSYIQTYVERDLRLIDHVENLELFGKFISLLAGLTSQEIKYNQLGREVGVSHQTAKRWVSSLSVLYQWRQISPYFANTIKRVSESSKGYLTDTGIACHLLRIASPQALALHPLLGALFETWAVNHIHQMFASCSMSPHVHHWRIHSGAEIDLILEANGCFYPIEIKCSQNLSKTDLYGFKAFREAYPKAKVMPNLILHAGEENYLLDPETLALSWKAL
jgi:uncharacterized protein